MQVGHLQGASSPIVAATNWCLASQLTVSSDVRTKRALIANAANPSSTSSSPFLNPMQPKGVYHKIFGRFVTICEFHAVAAKIIVGPMK